MIAEQAAFDLGVEPQDLEGEYLSLARRQKELEDEIDEIKKRRTVLEPEVMELWGNLEKRNEKRGGGEIYLYRGRYASLIGDTSEDQLCAALMDTDLRDIVKVGVNKISLTARLKEAEDQGGIPDALDGVVELRVRPTIRYRGAR
jgi:hypothetical protein